MSQFVVALKIKNSKFNDKIIIIQIRLLDDDGAYNDNQEEELGDDENQEENEDRVEAAEAEGLSCYPRGANAPNCHSVFI